MAFFSVSHWVLSSLSSFWSFSFSFVIFWSFSFEAVSYTHLTLPTILRV